MVEIRFYFDPVHIDAIIPYLEQKSFGVLEKQFFFWCDTFKTKEEYIHALGRFSARADRNITLERLDELIARAAGFPHGILIPHVEIYDTIIAEVNKNLSSRIKSTVKIQEDPHQVTQVVRHYLLSNLLFGDILAPPCGIREENRKEEYYIADVLSMYSQIHLDGNNFILTSKDAIIARHIIDVLTRVNIKQLDNARVLIGSLLPITTIESILHYHPTLQRVYSSAAKLTDPEIVAAMNDSFKKECIQAAKEYYTLT